jgi:Cu(I)-responsive transcriptional regulator
MNIGQAAKASGISAKMIRYYESKGLISTAGRTPAGYRFYRDRDVHTLRFIRRARDLGFAMENIAELLSLWRDRTRRSADVKRMALGHIASLKRRIAEMESMANTLETLGACCAGDHRPECPILADIETGAPLPTPVSRQRFGAASDRRAVKSISERHSTVTRG